MVQTEIRKNFNIAGSCVPSSDYIVDTGAKIGRIIEYIEPGKYFTIALRLGRNICKEQHTGYGCCCQLFCKIHEIRMPRQ